MEEEAELWGRGVDSSAMAPQSTREDRGEQDKEGCLPAWPCAPQCRGEDTEPWRTRLLGATDEMGQDRRWAEGHRSRAAQGTPGVRGNGDGGKTVRILL